jgi:hypothetical protein
MHSTFSSLRRLAGLTCVGAVLVLPALRSYAADATPDADAFPTFDSYVKISGQAPFMTGDRAAFADRSGTPNTGSFGIEDLFYSKDLSDSTTIKVNGRALDGSDDYLGSVNLSNDNVGSVDVGYKRFRTFYDGVGGFFPLADQFQAMSPQSLHVDRGSFWVNAKYGKSEGPVLTVSFHDDVRTGEKDSTIWAPEFNPSGISTIILNGGTVLLNPTTNLVSPANSVYVLPNVISLAEHHRTLDAGLTDKVGKITETLKVTLDWVNNLDTRYYEKYPNSIVNATTTTLTGKPTASGSYYQSRVLDDQESVDSKGLRILDQVEAKLSDKFNLEAGVTYHHVASYDGGEWITPSYGTTALAVFPTATAENIAANATVDDYVANLVLKYTPTKDWLAEAGIRDEYNVISDSGGFMTTALSSTATSLASTNVTTNYDPTYSHEDDHVLSPEVSLQYLGIKNVSLYANIDKRVNHGEQHWVNPFAETSTTGLGVVTTTFPAPINDVFFQNANQDYMNAKIGANWNASTEFTLRAEIFRKDHQNQFGGTVDPTITKSFGGLFATGYEFTGLKLSAVYKPMPQLSFTTRYQPQDGNMSVLGSTITGGNGTEITSGKTRVQTISETVDWAPYRQIYVQGNINVAYNYIETAYPIVVQSLTTNYATPIQNANNNYITGTALCGFVLDKQTDAQIQGAWQQATNYNPQIAAGGQPYGASFFMESITAGLKHKFNNRLMGDAKIGYLRSTDGTTGGFTNYKGPLAYVSLSYSL